MRRRQWNSVVGPVSPPDSKSSSSLTEGYLDSCSILWNHWYVQKEYLINHLPSILHASYSLNISLDLKELHSSSQFRCHSKDLPKVSKISVILCFLATGPKSVLWNVFLSTHYLMTLLLETRSPWSLTSPNIHFKLLCILELSLRVGRNSSVSIVSIQAPFKFPIYRNFSPTLSIKPFYSPNSSSLFYPVSSLLIFPTVIHLSNSNSSTCSLRNQVFVSANRLFHELVIQIIIPPAPLWLFLLFSTCFSLFLSQYCYISKFNHSSL